MNRYRAGGPSKASATTLCQKCLKKGHYSYECTATQQERPYISRPSRTQQLLNPKLAPKLSATVPEPTPEVKMLDSKPAREDSRSRQQSRDRRRQRSISTHSSDSVSTISTNRSESPRRRSTTPDKRDTRRRKRGSSLNKSGGAADRSERPAARRRSPSPPRQRQPRQSRSRSPYRETASKGPEVRQRREESPARERSLSPYSRRMAMTRAAANGT